MGDSSSPPAPGSRGDEATGSSDRFLREVAGLDPSTPSTPRVERPIGSRVGRYLIERELGRGGMGVVYEAHDEALKRKVAVKVLPTHRADDPRHRARFLVEARALASIVHPNAATIYDVGEDRGCLYIAMELVEGETLRARLRRGPLEVDEVLRVGAKIARGLAVAHARGIVHRDLKPENVAFDTTGEPKILDFGLAKARADGIAAVPLEEQSTGAPTTEAGALVGTPGYLAPEQAAGHGVDARADLFSLGVILYEALAGRRPFVGASAAETIAAVIRDEPSDLSKLNGRIPPDVAALVGRCLAKSPARRPESAATLASSLEELGVRAAASVAPRRRRLTAWAALAISAAVAIAGGAVYRERARLAAPSAALPAATSTTAAPPSQLGVAMTDLPLPRSTVPAALAAYKAGMQALRDADVASASSDFATARQLDPSMGAAYLRSAGDAMMDARLYHEATELRSTLPEHEAALLDALLPCAQQRGGDDRFCVERMRALTRRFPLDADFARHLARRLFGAGEYAAARDAARRALELDPKCAAAREIEIAAVAYLGDPAEIERAVDLCVKETPSPGCLLPLARLRERQGRGDDLYATAQAVLAMSPNDTWGLQALAQGAACMKRPDATLRGVIDRVVAAGSPESQSWNRAAWEMKVAARNGDFAAVRRFNEEATRRYGSSPDLSLRYRLAWNAIWVALETGRAADAADVGRAYLDVRETLVGTTPESDDALVEHAMWPMLVALRRAGRMSREELRAERDKFVAEWRPRLGRGHLPYLWLATYAATAEDADEAREALEVLPSFEGLPREFFQSYMQDELHVGNVFLRAGRVEESIPWLVEAAHACRFGDPRVMWASVSLGEAYEKLGRTSEACDAYGAVVIAWGDAKPRSISLEAAKARRKALACRP